MMQTKLLAMISLVMLLVVIIPGGAYAQNDEIIEEFETERLPYFGLGAGYMRLFMFPDYEEMNNVSRALGLGDFTGPFSLDMGGLTFTPGFVPNLRAGFYVGSGITQLSRQVRLQDTPYTRTMYFSTVEITSQIDYAIGITSAFTIFPGLMLGGGRSTLGVSQTQNDGAHFDEVFNGGIFNGDSIANSRNLNRFARALSYHVFLYPTLNLEYTLTPNIMIRVGAGYNTSMRITPWSDEGGVELLGSPTLTINGPAFQVGIFGGLFQH